MRWYASVNYQWSFQRNSIIHRISKWNRRYTSTMSISNPRMSLANIPGESTEPCCLVGLIWGTLPVGNLRSLDDVISTASQTAEERWKYNQCNLFLRRIQPWYWRTLVYLVGVRRRSVIGSKILVTALAMIRVTACSLLKTRYGQ